PLFQVATTPTSPKATPRYPRIKACFRGLSGASRAVSQAPATPITMRYEVASRASASLIGSLIGGKTRAICSTTSTSVVATIATTAPATTAQMDCLFMELSAVPGCLSVAKRQGASCQELFAARTGRWRWQVAASWGADREYAKGQPARGEMRRRRLHNWRNRFETVLGRQHR